ncbi:hypothetical protein SUGI_0911280 [Cryptomeria japonica]|nr:hypothetical protein SUGI_0911280 [Cryptomeria japonica]
MGMQLVIEEVIDPLISSPDSDMLMAPYSLEEIKKATFALHPHKAPELDGCTTKLFQKGWEFMGKDIWVVVEEFQKKHKFVKKMNHTIICLILKKVDCDSMSDYRPISLCNTIYKIISKAMAERLKKVLPKLVSENQNGFTPDRETANNIILVSEVIHSLYKKKLKCMIVKIDVAKAYHKEASGIRNTLEEYTPASGQVMNKVKSQLFFFNTNRQAQGKNAQLLDISIAEYPIKYLGVWINKGCMQSQNWEDVTKSCESKSKNWKNRWLTLAGRITMIKSILSAIPIYSMSCFKMPFAAGKSLNNLLKKFVWDGAKDNRKIPLIN